MSSFSSFIFSRKLTWNEFALISCWLRLHKLEKFCWLQPWPWLSQNRNWWYTRCFSEFFYVSSVMHSMSCEQYACWRWLFWFMYLCVVLLLLLSTNKFYLIELNYFLISLHTRLVWKQGPYNNSRLVGFLIRVIRVITRLLSDYLGC